MIRIPVKIITATASEPSGKLDIVRHVLYIGVVRDDPSPLGETSAPADRERQFVMKLPLAVAWT